jgi:hypothetical protein
MAVHGRVKEVERREMTGTERLGLRVSNMINHPFAQFQRWVTIHKMDSDAEGDWQAVMGVLAETDGIEMVFNEDDQSVTLKWEVPDGEDRPTEAADPFEVAEAAPF